jgi:homocysteine S-methyltransferase
MTSPALARLVDPESLVLFDGAMGTMLYAKGVFINQCYDELNVARPISCATCTAPT